MTSKEALEDLSGLLLEYRNGWNDIKDNSKETISIIKKDLDRLEKLKQLMKDNYFESDSNVFIDLAFNTVAAKEIKEWLFNETK